MASKLINPDGDTRYLVRIDGKVFGILETKNDALATRDAIASGESQKLEKHNTTVFRRYLVNEKDEVQLYTQSSGKVFQGWLNRGVSIDIVSVPRMKIREVETTRPSENGQNIQ